MLFDVSCELEYSVRFPSTLILNIHPQRTAAQTIVRERLIVEPQVRIDEFTPAGSENRFIRLETGSHRALAISYSASVECDARTYAAGAVEDTPVAALSGAEVPYLFRAATASRTG